MRTRRGLLAAAGIAFCSCCMLEAARAQADGPARLPVSVGGKRVKTIDAHSHCLFADALELLGTGAQAALPATKGVQEHFLAESDIVAGRLASMDAMGIDMEILSINPFWYGQSREVAARIVELNNHHLAELCAAHPDRFGAFAGLTMQFPDLAVKQLEDAIGKHGLQGAAIGASVLGEASPSRNIADPGQGRGTRGGAVHPSAEHPGAGAALRRQWLDVQHDRQPARHHAGAAAPDLRGHAGPVSGPEDPGGAWRRLSGVLRAARSTMPASSRRRTAIPASC